MPANDLAVRTLRNPTYEVVDNIATIDVSDYFKSLYCAIATIKATGSPYIITATNTAENPARVQFRVHRRSNLTEAVTIASGSQPGTLVMIWGTPVD